MSMARATKAELELRVGEAASMLAEGNGATVVTAHVAETYRLSRRQARRITAAAYELLVQDLEEVDLSRPQITAQLVANLQSAIQKSLVLGRTGSVASNARALIHLCGLAADSSYNQRNRKN
ncbi:MULTISPECIES: hypothetical protein [Prochlorococcus]|uniref:Uncharacterized protein n=3 Tax=Prochlorococcaceae TaxID=2881426 RepID=Q7VCV6_PROMA|nr:MULTISPECIES: hypothetical protein [Prochlorococcus]AAP99678.1 Predicted protein [Prochlorococcus marinus subsp. marinus str. CCMP1375]KGG24342.1 hypothetical protein EV09_0389 [Prochlorococcus marinus str. SS35]KGG33626.1 hypothetical protein EV10_0466 [Prochlorococcus marinus str. SS51]KGG36459.1 hypothetical protein EV11_0831 [Prochlorococcus sp. SS52]